GGPCRSRRGASSWPGRAERRRDTEQVGGRCHEMADVDRDRRGIAADGPGAGRIAV
ncbi:MAG: hypothetical protein AVDCRST_MAG49-220, partial [uncultured Thermomicrobiales bacterium]